MNFNLVVLLIYDDDLIYDDSTAIGKDINSEGVDTSCPSDTGAGSVDRFRHSPYLSQIELASHCYFTTPTTKEVHVNFVVHLSSSYV